MKINEGHVRFYDVNDKDDMPSKDDSIKDLFMLALQQDTVYDEETTNYKKQNRDNSFINTTMKNVFLENTGDTIDLTEDMYDYELSVNYFEDYHDAIEQQRASLGALTIENSPWLKAVSMSISLIDNPIMKKCLIMWLGSTGTLMQCKTFRLITEFDKKDVQDIDKETLQQIIADNIELNAIIDELREERSLLETNIIENFLEEASLFAQKGYEDVLKEKLTENLDELISLKNDDNNRNNMSNLKRTILGNKAYENSSGWVCDEDNPKESLPLMVPENFKDFWDLLKQTRIQIKNTRTIKLDLMYIKIPLANSKTSTRKIFVRNFPNAYNWFISLFANNRKMGTV